MSKNVKCAKVGSQPWEKLAFSFMSLINYILRGHHRGNNFRNLNMNRCCFKGFFLGDMS